MSRLNTISVLGAMVASLFALTACGGSAESTTGDGGLKTVKVGVIPVSTVAPMYIGHDEKFFEDNGLELEVVTVQNEAAAVASVLSGDLDFAFSTTASLIQAQSKGLEVGAVTGVTQSPGGDPSTSLVAGPGSGIKDVSQLEGKTISVNSLRGQSELGIRIAAEKAGVPQESLTFVAMPFAESVAALTANRVDASGLVAPFSNSAVSEGASILIPDYYTEMHPRATITTWFTSNRLAKQEPELMRSFDEAMKKSYEFAAKNDDRVGAEIPKFTKTPADVADDLPKSRQVAETNLESIADHITSMKKFGLLDGEVSADEFIVEALR
jgi:NitT/TauT family transport system substrate-binding protein